MATDLKRYTISITPGMEAALDSAKRKHYHKGSKNDMIRDLISRGLDSLENESHNNRVAHVNIRQNE